MSDALSGGLSGAAIGGTVGGPVGALVGGGLGLVGGALFGRKRRDNRAAIARLRASRNTGYLTPEDLRAAEQTRGRLRAGAVATGQQSGAEVSRRARARGLAGSPSEERDQARIAQQVALGSENAGNTAEEQLYNIQRGREAFQNQADLAIFGAETNANIAEGARQDAQNAEFWNSTNGLVGGILQSIPKDGATPSSPYAPENAIGPPAPPPAVPGGFDPTGGNSALGIGSRRPV